MITRTQGEAILSRIPEFSDSVSEYELNSDGVDHEMLKGVPGFITRLYEFDMPKFREHVESLPTVEVIDPDATPTKEQPDVKVVR